MLWTREQLNILSATACIERYPTERKNKHRPTASKPREEASHVSNFSADEPFAYPELMQFICSCCCCCLSSTIVLHQSLNQLNIDFGQAPITTATKPLSVGKMGNVGEGRRCRGSWYGNKKKERRGGAGEDREGSGRQSAVEKEMGMIRRKAK